MWGILSTIADLSITARNAVGKMRSLALVLTSFNLLQVVVRCQELSVIRHADGDIFTIEGGDHLGRWSVYHAGPQPLMTATTTITTSATVSIKKRAHLHPMNINRAI
ncbi:hypothetical protein DBV15_01527 [Temnothorax longispinosus]|uniref:Uncharacterized protein n=1 Tax=Temnothorax longispinosus TaxID=300112 RepID=A0A4V3SBM1_9HYME|nr:hypothetical protein DBV15_01527 [Temnothorax longispinosus]